jgi:hypothetical protein
MVSLVVWCRGGIIVGRCDAKCYNARHPTCNCVCGGANHGAGLETSTEQTRQHAHEWIARARRRGWQIDDYHLDPTVQQEPLF